jgi:hypothetical protein
MAKKQAPKQKKREGDGWMPDGSDLRFHGIDEVYGAGDDSRPSFNLRDPRQVQARLDQRDAMRAAKKPAKPTKGAK